MCIWFVFNFSSGSCFLALSILCFLFVFFYNFLVVQPQINHSTKQMFATLVMKGYIAVWVVFLFFKFVLFFSICFCGIVVVCVSTTIIIVAFENVSVFLFYFLLLVWHLKFQHICFDCCNSWWVVVDVADAVAIADDGGNVELVLLLLLLLFNVAFQWSMVFVNFMVIWAEGNQPSSRNNNKTVII